MPAMISRRPARPRNRLGRSLVRVDAAEEEQVFTAVWVEGKVIQPNAVVDCCCMIAAITT
jgi:hypothetical protein